MEDEGGAELTVLGLMQAALAILDRTGEGLAAVRLQHAIDALSGPAATSGSAEEEG